MKSLPIIREGFRRVVKLDLATIVGIFAGLSFIGVAIAMKPGALFFINAGGAMIVFGGVISATLVNFPLKDFLSVFSIVRNAFRYKAQSVSDLIDQIVEMSRKSRVEGLLSIEKDIDQFGDDFMKKGIQLMVDGTETDILKDILGIEVSYLEDRHAMGQDILKAMGAYAPAFGMVGTLIGLIQMLQQLSDPTQIGAGMAVAMVTTFYGVLLANLFFLPIAGKLKRRSKQEILIKELLIEGICSIQEGENPRILRDKLVMFLAPSHRLGLEKPEEEV